MPVEYDSTILQKFADGLYKKATTVVFLTTIGWLLAGAIFALVAADVAESWHPTRTVTVEDPSRYAGNCDSNFPNSEACRVIPAQHRLVSVPGGAEELSIFLFAVPVLTGIGGFFRGQARAFALRLEAQKVLCQVAIESNVRLSRVATNQSQ